MKILIINGPNLNLVGKREEDIYGSQNFTSYLKKLRKQYPEIHIDFVQTNIEGEIIDALHKASLVYNGIILNAGGYTHTSVAIADAIRAINTSVIEVHISNTFARESFRHTSLIAPVVKEALLDSVWNLTGWRWKVSG